MTRDQPAHVEPSNMIRVTEMCKIFDAQARPLRLKA
jgi:hypothetical protein